MDSAAALAPGPAPRRRLALASAAAGVVSLLVAWDGLMSLSFTDYENEAQPALRLLAAGHPVGFLTHLPAYAGSLVMRAPFAMAPCIWGGGDLAVFRAAAVPCLLAAALLAVHLFSRLEARGRRGAAWLALLLVTASPFTLKALEFGHPEDLLGAVLCATAVLAALRGRWALAGGLLGAAIANKQWAVLAIGPVALALERDRLRAIAVAFVGAGLVLAPVVIAVRLTGGGGVGGLAGGALRTSVFFHPWQVWWFLGDHAAHVVNGVDEARLGIRRPPGWLDGVTHPLIVVLAAPLSLLWARGDLRHRQPGRPRSDALLLLAFVMLMRCLLDPWDNAYYMLPFLIALICWEAVAAGRAPWAALVATLGLWTAFELVGDVGSPDAESAAFLVLSLPLAALLGLRLYAPAASARLAARAGGWAGAHLPNLASRFAAPPSVQA